MHKLAKLNTRTFIFLSISTKHQKSAQPTPTTISQKIPLTTMSVAAEDTTNKELSALKDNIERKGKNAYYYAHAHNNNGPKWDGKPEPKLLSKHSSSDEGCSSDARVSSFDLRSTITSYAFCDEDQKVKIYVNLDAVGEKCGDDDISIEYTKSSFVLSVKNYTDGGVVERLSFARLYGDISSTTFKKKPNKIIITLKKEESLPWPSIGHTSSA